MIRESREGRRKKIERGRITENWEDKTRRQIRDEPLKAGEMRAE